MTKIPRHYEPHDYCSISIGILEKKIQKLLANKSGQLFFADSTYQANDSWEHLDKPLQLILFGDLLRKFFQTGNLVHRDVEIYQIGSSHQKILSSVLVDKTVSNISTLISRYDLFPESMNSLKVDLNKELNFIYAGRISYQKNIPYLLYFIKACREKGLKVNLQLYGDYDNQFHEHLGRRQFIAIETILKQIIQVEDLESIVFFRGRVSSQAWLETNLPQPIGVSMSTFFGEDFGVSLAQAQEKGWSILYSEFGGHKDIKGENTFSIPSSFVGHSHLPLELQEMLASRAADFFIAEGFQKRGAGNNVPSQGKVITLANIDEARRKLAKDLGIATQWLNLEGIDVFSDLKSGGTLIRRCLDVLETPLHEKGHEICLILAKEEREVLKTKTEAWLNSFIKELTKEDKVHILFEDELVYGDSMVLLKRSHRAHCSQTVSSKTRDFVKNLFGN